MTLAVNIAQGASNNVTFRNKLINGGMVIDQRNAGAAVTISGDPSYSVDRFIFGKGSPVNNFTAQQSTNAPAGFYNSLLVTAGTGASASAAGYAFVRQPIEGFNISDLGWGTASPKAVTLSFWVKSSLTGTFGVMIRDTPGNVGFPATYTINAANTWEFKTVTIVGPTIGTFTISNGIGCQLLWDLGVGTNYSYNATGAWQTISNPIGVNSTVKLTATTGATWQLTGVQLEAGTTASPFEYRQYGTELALCQRYYQQSYDIGTIPGSVTGNGQVGWGAVNNGNGEFFQVRYPVFMRAQPTITTYNPSTGASGSVRNVTGATNVTAAINGGGMGGFSNLNAALTTGSTYLLHYTASAEL